MNRIATKLKLAVAFKDNNMACLGGMTELFTCIYVHEGSNRKLLTTRREATVVPSDHSNCKKEVGQKNGSKLQQLQD